MMHCVVFFFFHSHCTIFIGLYPYPYLFSVLHLFLFNGTTHVELVIWLIKIRILSERRKKMRLFSVSCRLAITF